MSKYNIFTTIYFSIDCFESVSLETWCALLICKYFIFQYTFIIYYYCLLFQYLLTIISVKFNLRFIVGLFWFSSLGTSIMCMLDLLFLSSIFVPFFLILVSYFYYIFSISPSCSPSLFLNHSWFLCCLFFPVCFVILFTFLNCFLSISFLSFVSLHSITTFI